jgi:glyoxylase-like metal-dependent hydrolase (beta-lactamase superfamily II)/pimeloyl-ACP methyl ester carboxylesterase
LEDKKMQRPLIRRTSPILVVIMSIVFTTSISAVPGTIQAAGSSLISSFKSGVYKGEGVALPYRCFDPSNPKDAGKKYPLILYLHSEDERGTDNVKQLTGTKGATIWLEPDHLEKHPVYVLAPQIPAGSDWSNEPVYLATKNLLQNFIAKNSSVDKDRIYIEGISMGGTGTWNMILKNPKMYAAALTMSGNADAFLKDDAAFAGIKNMPIMVVHSEDDPVSPVKGSDDAVAALKKQGNTSVQYHKWVKGSLPVPHNAWETAFEKYEVVYNFLFMFSLSKTNYNQVNPSDLFVTRDLGNGVKEIWDMWEDTIYVVEGKEKAIVIDTGMATGSLYQFIRDNVLRNKNIDIEILITHKDGDHVKGIPSFVGAPQFKKLYIHEADYPSIKPYFGTDQSKVTFVKDGDKIPFNGKNIDIIEVPCHSVGSIVFMYGDNLFTGDAIGTGYLHATSGLISIEDYADNVQHLLDRMGGRAFKVWGGHTGECRFPLDQEYVKNVLQCAKDIVDGKGITAYHRRPTPLGTYKNAHITYAPAAVKVEKAVLTSLALSRDTSSTEFYTPVNINEKFLSLTAAYTATVDIKSTPYIYLRPTTSARSSVIKINNVVVASGVAYKANLGPGENKFTISVNAKDGTTRTYTVTVKA